MDENAQKPNNPIITKWSMATLALEIGFIIAMPLVLFALAGKWVDTRLDTFPLITMAGILLAVTSTTVWMTRRLKKYIK